MTPTSSAREPDGAPGTGNVLVVYSMLDHPLRESVRDHLCAFRRYSQRRCFYLNLAVRRVPAWLRRAPFDLLVFHTTFLSKRSSPAYFERLRERARPLKALDAVRIALPQDEYLPPASLCEFIDEFGIDYVFSVAPPSEWPTIYPSVDRSRVRISRVLTGYLDRGAIDRMERLGAPSGDRPVDIGYRAKDLPPWLGRHARLKAEMAARVAEAAPAKGLVCDISTRAEDTLLGGDWLRFLLSCKYTIGAEGGASLLDRDGTIRARTERFLAEHPGASFEEVEASCFPGRDGSFGLVALSPRHLEACATRTCQVLVEGDYNGVLEAGRHYIPLRRDLGNLDEVLETVKRDDRRQVIVEAAYRDVVASGAYTYERFVSEVEAAALGGRGAAPPPRALDGLREMRSRVGERLSCLEVVARVRLGGRALRMGARLRRSPPRG
ncbi:MAG TPA: hypothetical protein VKB17_04330 [Thermoleophilaceae bacterium]|nr:hypothetical protein [Thermoleophilaceae bacterium]